MQGLQRVSSLRVMAMMAAGLAGEAAAADVYRACADSNNQQVRPSSIQVNTPALCTAKETERVWNQAGPAGPAGPVGPQGPAGPSLVYLKAGQPLVTLGTTPAGSFPLETQTEIATFQLPAGNYVITASVDRMVNASFTDAERAEVRCFLKSPDGTQLETSAVHTTVGPRQTESLLVTGVALPTADKTYSLVCSNRDPVGAVTVGEYRIQALKVGTLNWL